MAAFALPGMVTPLAVVGTAAPWFKRRAPDARRPTEADLIVALASGYFTGQKPGLAPISGAEYRDRQWDFTLGPVLNEQPKKAATPGLQFVNGPSAGMRPSQSLSDLVP